MNMKKTAMVLTLVLLAGCAAQQQGLRETDLRNPELMRGEKLIGMNFPKLQGALFKHQAACGEALTFKVDAGQTSYATIIYNPAGTDTLEHAVMLDLVQHKANFLHDERVKATIYTYYWNAGVEDSVDHVLRIFSHPELCKGDPTPAPEPKEQSAR